MTLVRERQAQGLGLGLVWVGVAVAVVVPLVSALFDLYDRIWFWGKVVHAVDVFALAWLFGLLLLAYRDCYGLQIPTPLVALASMMFGVAIGLGWEFGSFMIDWVFKTDLQKSNTDTMTDFLCMDLAAVVASLLAVRLWTHGLHERERRPLGELAARLTTAPGILLDRHPRLVALTTALLILAYIALLWFVDRSFPGLPTD